ncbi:MAG: hypothetical protein WAM76_10415 [Pseudolabrys sp.]|jgi:hypothetical protein
MATPTIDERRALARGHVEWGRVVIGRQQQYVKELRKSGRDTEAAEKLLLVCERTQKIFERDLTELEKHASSTVHSSANASY